MLIGEVVTSDKIGWKIRPADKLCENVKRPLTGCATVQCHAISLCSWTIFGSVGLWPSNWSYIAYFQCPRNHIDKLMQSNAWSGLRELLKYDRRSYEEHGYCNIIGPACVHHWLEESGIRMAHRRLERLKFVLMRNNWQLRHRTNNRQPFPEPRESKPKEPLISDRSPCRCPAACDGNQFISKTVLSESIMAIAQ